MASTIKELRTWLAQFNEDRLVGVDEGGLTLVVIDDDTLGLDVQPQYELGGLPEEGEKP